MFNFTKKQLIIFLLCFFIFFMLCIKYKNKNNNKILANLENDHKPMLINFNTDWCYFSKKLQPTWDQFTKIMKNKNIEILDIKCDLDKNIDMCNRYEIEGYPTIKLVVNNQIIDYDGVTTLDELSKFINRNIKV